MEVVILCGISGSGKTTAAENIMSKCGPGECLICSADHYMVDGTGNYRFDPTRLETAHSSCLRKFLEAILAKNGLKVVIVDNTNLTAAEIAPYAALASSLGCSLKILVHIVDPFVASQRSKHNVPILKLFKQAARLPKEIDRFPAHWARNIKFNAAC